MAAIRQRTHNVEFHGVGGTSMLEQGLYPIVDMDRFAVNGFREPLKRIPSLYADLRKLVGYFTTQDMSVVVGIDFNFFNQMLELRLKRKGLKTVHYVSPSVWAWRQSRLKKIRKATDVVMTLFPFEPQIYVDHGIAAEFVGHPLADKFDPEITKESLRHDARSKLGIDADSQVIALLPGSRKSELAFHTELFLSTAAQLSTLRGDSWTCLIPVVQPDSTEWLQNQVQSFPNLDVRLLQQESDLALAAADVALLKSGTSTLEAMLLKTPMVVAYRIGELTYRIVSRMLKTQYIALPNILSGSELVPEFIQQEAVAPSLAEALNKQLSHAGRDSELIQNYQRLHQELRRDAATSAANTVLKVAGVS